MPQFFLALGVLCVSAAAPLIRLAAPMPPLVIAAGRVSVAAMLLAALSWRNFSSVFALWRQRGALMVVGGLLLSAHFAAWIGSLSLTSTAASMALVATQPLFAAALGWAFLAERVARRELAGMVVATLGLVVLARGDIASRDALVGDVLAVAGAATAAGYFTASRAVRDSLPLLPFLAVVNAVAAAPLWVAIALRGEPCTGYPPSSYAAVLAMAVVCSVFGHTLLNRSVRWVPVHLVGLAILGEPVLSSLGTWLLQGEIPPMHAVFGGAGDRRGRCGLWARAHSEEERDELGPLRERSPIA